MDFVEELERAEREMTMGDAISEVIYAYMAESLYTSGKINKKDFINKAGAFLECSRPFDKEGDFICPHCVGKYLESALDKRYVLK